MAEVKEFQRGLVAAWSDYAAGRIDAKTLKGASAGFGIYQQRDDRTMMRIRRPGGEISLGDLRAAAAILRAHGGAFAHLTTRQDIQLHGIPADQVTAALSACEDASFHFRGGGGDTFRNTLVSAFSGLHEDSVFDVVPYAKALTEAFYTYDLAYALPRKLKIGFADRPAEAWLARTNDLGFVAKIVDGKRVFETWLAGGIGFKPKTGLLLFDALPAEECIRVAMALAALFNDRGCRTNRAHARIRFLREDLGDEALAALLKEYLAKLPADVDNLGRDALLRVRLLAHPTQCQESPVVSTVFPVTADPAAGFEVWKELAVTPLANGLAAVRIFVPFGNFTPEEIDAFTAAMEKNGATRFTALSSLDLGLVVPAAQLAGVYNALASLDRDYVARSFVGNIRTCIGCTVCKSGVTDAPAMGRAVAEYCDAKWRPLDTPEKVALAKLLLNEVRISGCPNSCTNHPLARFGFAGRKVDGQDAETPYTSGSLEPLVLGAVDATATPIPASDFPAYLEEGLLASLPGRVALLRDRGGGGRAGARPSRIG